MGGQGRGMVWAESAGKGIGALEILVPFEKTRRSCFCPSPERAYGGIPVGFEKEKRTQEEECLIFKNIYQKVFVSRLGSVQNPAFLQHTHSFRSSFSLLFFFFFAIEFV